MNALRSRSCFRRPSALALCVGVALGLSACDDDDDDDALFVVRTGAHGVDPTSASVVGGSWLVYFADEGSSGGTDLNGDGDVADEVAVAVPLNGTKATVLRAAQAAAIAAGQVYLVVDEALDGMDWDGDAMEDDLVLLHWNKDLAAPQFVDLVDPLSLDTEPFFTVPETGVYYVSAAEPTGDETSLRFLGKDEPATPVVVSNQTGGGALRPLILGESAGLLFLALDEATAPGGPLDYNDDADTDDGAVIALLDVTSQGEDVVVVPLAMADTAAPFAAHRDLQADDWLIGVLVNEDAQGATNLNDPALFTNFIVPDSCAASPDVDAADDVLFYGFYSELALAMPAVNTGLAGRDRVVAVDGFVATLSDEADATCDLNEDGDATDTMVRWVAAVEPVEPPRDPSQLHAVLNVPGGSHGLAWIGDRLVTVVDEAADDDDVNGDGGKDDMLVGFLVPDDGPTATWTFQHPDENPGTGVAGIEYVSVNWMAAEPSQSRLAMAFQEELGGINLNVDFFCNLVVKDADATDSLPVWPDFESSGTILDFDGQGYALHEADPGVVLSKGWAFYRVSESADNFDYNTDGDKNDVILFRNPQASCATTAMATASSLAGQNPVVITDGLKGCVFLSSEFQAGVDFNEDGDMNDLVPRWFLF